MFEITYKLKGKLPEVSYLIDTITEAEAIRIANSWIVAEVPCAQIKKIVTREIAHTGL
jgi:hypothetical protein